MQSFLFPHTDKQLSQKKVYLKYFIVNIISKMVSV